MSRIKRGGENRTLNFDECAVSLTRFRSTCAMHLYHLSTDTEWGDNVFCPSVKVTS